MELEAASRRARLLRMDDQDRVSQASSVATISYFPVKESDGKVQTFGKRCQAATRDPNCPVVIRGWLNKKDSSGLKLWKRRWFVLSNYCLFYYKDSREESVLGSIPLPSYRILFCTPRECKNRKFTFKVVHQGMRSYFFSADTQEDMLGWVRALSQSAAMEPESSINRRCSSYQDFTQIGGSSESVNFPKSPSDGESTAQKQRNISRTLSEPSQLTGGRMGTEQRGRRSVRQRNSSPSNRTPSPHEFSSRRVCGPNQEEDSLPGQNTPPIQTDIMGTGSSTSRGQLGSRPHTPVGRVDIRPHDDPVMVPQTLYYAPASPNLEFKSTPNTPGTERWQNLSKPAPAYGSVQHLPSGRRPLAKSYSTGAHAELLPPLPPSSRAAHVPHHPHHHHHHHHHRSHLSVCVLPPAMAPKPDPRETPPVRPLESDADAVLTRLCGCDKLLQSLSVELAQLQMDKDSVQCALDVSRLQLEEWQCQGPQVQEEALTQKALLQEELVTIRARMCDVLLEIERVWTQYERMESELSVIRSHLQHICNFGMPQEQSQAQRELWMMEDILSGLKVNRDHFRFLLGLQRHHVFHQHPESTGSPTERLQSGLPMDIEQEPPVRPPLPQELQESHHSREKGYGYTESPYEGIYSHPVDAAHRKGSSQADLLNVKAHKDASESQSGSKWIPSETMNQSTKKIKMSEEEQIERMKKNQERLINKKKSCLSASGSQTQSQNSETREEAPFPLRVTRVVTAVLPSSLVARRVSVEDPPAELDTVLPEQIPPEMHQRLDEQSKMLKKSPRRLLLLDNPDQTRSSVETHQDQLVKKTSREQHQGVLRSSKKELQPDASRAEVTENSRHQVLHQAGLGNGTASSDSTAEEQPSVPMIPDTDTDFCLTPEQREAKLRRVERIRERVIRSAVRESATHNQLPNMGERQEVHQASPDTSKKQKNKPDHELYSGWGKCADIIRRPAEVQLPSELSQKENERDKQVKKSKSQEKFGNKTQHKDHSGRKGVAKIKSKRPDSPYHISSMTVYQKDRGKGFTSCKDDEEKKLEKPALASDENDFSSSDLRTKWFLSTNQWQGFIPLQIPGIDSLCNEETSDMDNQLAFSDDVTDSTEMSSTVSESLEKMKKNHSLFYKIACDINISDTDIAKSDGNTNVQMSSKPEEEEKLFITESAPDNDTSNAGRSSNQGSKDISTLLSSDANGNSHLTDNKLQHLKLESQDKAVLNTSASPAKEMHVYEEVRQEKIECTSRHELKVKESNHGASAEDTDCDQALEECARTREEQSGMKDSEDRKVDKERAEDMRKTSSSNEENEDTIQAGGDGNSISPSSSMYKTGSLSERASIGKARVTVLRTSL
ncbi:pleckstrin homology domain-containing family A member 7 isoform X1 [Channa argus]|uniref:pleckstrin homology domain-containing family A member 7 isoform X1 n=2 Tax=Channa argus TaxID=215402 RepID=UPI0035225CC2